MCKLATTAQRKQLNTPVNASILDAFRTNCEAYNLNMNVVLEALMNDFNAGNYDLIISKTDGIKVVKK